VVHSDVPSRQVRVCHSGVHVIRDYRHIFHGHQSDHCDLQLALHVQPLPGDEREKVLESGDIPSLRWC
jgi:hypothetical protein